MHKNWFQDVLKVKEPKSAVKMKEQQCFMEKIEVENFATVFFSSAPCPQIASCWRNIANNFFCNFVLLCWHFLLV